MNLTEREFLGKILPDLDAKHQGRYRVHIPSLMHHIAEDQGIWCKNHIHKNRITPSKDGIYGQYYPLHAETIVIVKFFENDYNTGYIDRIDSDYEIETLPLKIKDRDDLYQLYRTPKEDNLFVMNEDTKDQAPNSIHLYYNKYRTTFIVDEEGIHVYTQDRNEVQIVKNENTTIGLDCDKTVRKSNHVLIKHNKKTMVYQDYDLFVQEKIREFSIDDHSTRSRTSINIDSHFDMPDVKKDGDCILERNEDESLIEGDSNKDFIKDNDQKQYDGGTEYLDGKVYSDITENDSFLPCSDAKAFDDKDSIPDSFYCNDPSDERRFINANCIKLDKKRTINMNNGEENTKDRFFNVQCSSNNNDKRYMNINSEGPEQKRYINLNSEGPDDKNFMNINCQGPDDKNFMNLNCEGPDDKNFMNINCEGADGKRFVNLNSEGTDGKRCINLNGENPSGQRCVNINSEGPPAPAYTNINCGVSPAFIYLNCSSQAGSGSPKVTNINCAQAFSAEQLVNVNCSTAQEGIKTFNVNCKSAYGQGGTKTLNVNCKSAFGQDGKNLFNVNCKSAYGKDAKKTLNVNCTSQFGKDGKRTLSVNSQDAYGDLDAEDGTKTLNVNCKSAFGDDKSQSLSEQDGQELSPKQLKTINFNCLTDFGKDANRTLNINGNELTKEQAKDALNLNSDQTEKAKENPGANHPARRTNYSERSLKSEQENTRFIVKEDAERADFEFFKRIEADHNV